MERGPSLKPASVCLLICLLWAGIYLPGLGSIPLKHEEPRRALPALRMLQTGDWLVPRIGAGPYLRKPPLLNWLIALCFRVSGGPNEFAARLPSVGSMLALALTMATTARRWLGASGALLAAIFVLTNFAVMETGRLAELEALYLALTGIALMFWLTAWQARANSWRLWCVPAPFLALGMLTKGPAHLFFFYGVAVAVLVYSGEWKTLLHAAHGISLIIVVAPFLGWAIPCALMVSGGKHLLEPSGAWASWWREISSRATLTPSGQVPLGEWLLRVPQGFVNFLPWTMLLPLLWSGRTAGHFARMDLRERALFQGLRWGMVATFLVVSLLPGGSARYVYPLVTVPSVLLAWVLRPHAGGEAPCVRPAWLEVWWTTNLLLYSVILSAAVAMPFFALAGTSKGLVVVGPCGIILLTVAAGAWRFREKADVLSLALRSATGMMLVTAVFAFAAVPRLNQPRAGHPREVASSIRAHMPPGDDLVVLDDGYQAFWYYLEPSVLYFRRLEDIPFAAKAAYFLVPANYQEACIAEAARQGVVIAATFDAADREHRLFVLLTRQELPTPPP